MTETLVIWRCWAGSNTRGHYFLTLYDFWTSTHLMNIWIIWQSFSNVGTQFLQYAGHENQHISNGVTFVIDLITENQRLAGNPAYFHAQICSFHSSAWYQKCGLTVASLLDYGQWVSVTHVRACCKRAGDRLEAKRRTERIHL